MQSQWSRYTKYNFDMLWQSWTFVTALSVLDVISCVLSNTSLKMTTYLLSRSMPVDNVTCGGKEKQQVIFLQTT